MVYGLRKPQASHPKPRYCRGLNAQNMALGVHSTTTIIMNPPKIVEVIIEAPVKLRMHSSFRKVVSSLLGGHFDQFL